MENQNKYSLSEFFKDYEVVTPDNKLISFEQMIEEQKQKCIKATLLQHKESGFNIKLAFLPNRSNYVEVKAEITGIKEPKPKQENTVVHVDNYGNMQKQQSIFGMADQEIDSIEQKSSKVRKIN